MGARVAVRRGTAVETGKRGNYPVRTLCRWWWPGLLLAVTLGCGTLNAIQRSGELRLPGLAAPVTVCRDEKGMAMIQAASQADALRALGFVTAQDRLFQMELSRRVAAGRISELAGEQALALDVRMRTIGFAARPDGTPPCWIPRPGRSSRPTSMVSTPTSPAAGTSTPWSSGSPASVPPPGRWRIPWRCSIT
jgi:hypothetical protein